MYIKALPEAAVLLTELRGNVFGQTILKSSAQLNNFVSELRVILVTLTLIELIYALVSFNCSRYIFYMIWNI